MNRSPHIVYLLSDEHRGQAMSHLGDPNVRTPNMDRLAQEGMSFNTAFANCPICVPSRGTILSGRHAHCSPMQFQDDAYRVNAPSTATLLRAQGYHTAYFGKSHLGMVKTQAFGAGRHDATRPRPPGMRTPERHRAGFQDWHGYEGNGNSLFDVQVYHNSKREARVHRGYETDVMADMLISYLEQYDPTQPLFLVWSVLPPHFPLDVPEKWLRHDPATLQVPPNFSDTPEYRRNLARYYAMIENLDWNLGRILDKLDELPGFQGDRTATVYFSDHGDLMGSHRRHSRKELPHEEGIRIPAIFRWPGHIAPTGVVDGMFSLVDLLPTTLGLVGATVPSHCQGRDFSPKLRGEAFVPPEDVFLGLCVGPRYSLDFLNWRAIRTDSWKYAFYEDGHEQLYDLRNDPFELHNVAADQPVVKMKLKQLLRQRMSELREPYFDVLMDYGVSMNAPTIDVDETGDTQNHPELAPPPCADYRF